MASPNLPEPPVTNPVVTPSIDPVLPPWTPPTQDPNPIGGNINDLSTTINERTLTFSPWGKYVPIIFGQDVIGAEVTLMQIVGGWLYLRLVWCVGEVEEITSVTLEDGTIPASSVFTHYTGTSTQGVDPTLAARVSGYADNMRDIGADDYSLCYTVAQLRIDNLESFPRFRATIKGLKMKSPLPAFKSSTCDDTVTNVGNIYTVTDDSVNGALTHTIKYEEDELINSDSYSFEIEVTSITDIGAGTALVEWCDVALVDTGTTLQMDLNAVGTYSGVATFTPFSATKNHLDIIVTGANNGVTITYKVVVYNTLGNAVKAYSNIAGVALNHLVTDSQIGFGLTSDLTTYLDLLDRNNEVLVDGSYSESRSSIGLSITRKAPIANYIELLRGYSRCTVENKGGVYHYHPLKPLAVSFSLTISEIRNVKPFIKTAGDVPNIVRVYYTDTFETPWKDNFIEVETAEVTSGAEYKREAVYRMNGYQTRTAAKRYAEDKINERLRIFSVKFRCNEAVYDHYEGETFNLTHPVLGATTFKMKMIAKTKVKNSEWEVIAVQEDDLIYSDEIADYEPNAGTISLPNPYTLIDATDLALTIETPKYQTAIYFSRMRVNWTQTLYDYSCFYRLELYIDATDLLVETQVHDKAVTQAVFNNIQEGILYRVELKIVAFGANVSTGITSTLLPVGKDFPPTDVSGFSGFEANGLVTLRWADAVDNQEIVHYYIQYGTSGFLWNDNNSKILQTRIDAKELLSNNVLVGTWDFLIKAVDNAGNESTNASRLEDIEVHLNSDFDTNTFGEFPRTIDTGASSGLTSIYSGRTTRYDLTVDAKAEIDWLTKCNASWTSLFGGAAMNTFTDPIMSYGAGNTNVLYSQTKDFGADYEGIFTLDTGSDEYWVNTDEALTAGGEMIESLDTSNPVTKVMQLSTAAAPTTWTDYASLSASTTARYMRLKLTSPNLTSRWRFNQGALKYRLLKTIQSQSYSGTTDGSGFLTITLDNSTTDMRLMTVNINTTGAAYAIIAKVGSSPWLSVRVETFDSVGAAIGSIDVTGTIQYI